MSARHQPGPWSRDKYGRIMDADGSDVLFRGTTILSTGSSDRIKMAECNTDLAAAAPDLLAALIDAMEWVEENAHTTHDFSGARAAIAKAKGE